MEAKKVQKSYFDVLGICCPSEVPLIDNILKPLAGVIEVSVIVPSRTVIVIHDDQIISQLEILKALNSARLEANIRVYGEENQGRKWPAPYTIGCGILVAVATFKFLFPPLRWVGLAAAMIGSPTVLLRSMASVRNMTMDVNILVFIAVAGAIALGDYWEAGTTVFLFTIAEWLESRASHKANAVMSSLMSMTPQKAVLAQTGQIIDVKDIIIDTILAVKAGEVIPMDGVVVEGSCEVDEKTLTGESLPVPKQIQSVVWAGTINLNGYISVRTTSLTDDCVVAKMAKLVEEAQNSKSRTQRLVDQFAKYYTPAVMVVSVCLVVVPAALRKHDLKHWAHLALVVLVSACPCALILSTPVATFCAFTKAATAGILVKGGDYLETLGKIKTMAFDKTGTITRGEFSVTSFRASSSGFSLNTLLFWVSSIESKASHPMAAALVAYAQSRSIEPKPESVKEFQNFPGEGIYGEIEGRNIYVGNKKIARRAGCQTVPPHGDDNEGGTVGYIFSGENLLGVFSMADTCRSGVLDAIKELKSLGIKTAMLTGDSKIAASRVQDQLQNALDEFHAELLPEDKVRIIEKLKMRGPTAMIGDGVNDAPALATADIGISMGIAGSALATETGHITLMSNDIRKVPQAIRLARKTLWKIRQNVVLAVVTKSAILVLAFCGHPLLWAAVLADVGTCLLVIFNSMLLLQGTSKPKGKRHVGHGSHSHSPHQKHACGSDHVHHQHNHSNQVKEHHCSHEDRKEVQACSHTAKPDLCVETSVKCNGHKCCATILHESPSHVIEITNSDNIEDTGEEDLCDDHIVCIEKCSTAESSQASCCQNSHDSSLKSNRSTSACQGHSSSVSSDVNHLGKEVDSKQVGEAHSDDHSHHHNHHHDHLHDHHPVLALSDEKKTISTVHNEGRNVDCHACHEPKNGTMKMCSKEVKTVHLGKSLERREIGGCCRSYRKECGGMHGCQPLTEIISE